MFVGILVKTCYHPPPPPPPPPPSLPLASWEILIKLMPNCSPWHKEAEMFLFSIQFTLRMFFTAFHYLVLASFCSCSKSLDWIQWALFLTTHSLHVIDIWKGDRKKRLSASQHMKGIHTLYIFTWPILPLHRLGETIWHSFLLCSFHCSLRQSSCAESTLLLYQGVPLHVSLFSQGSTRTESSY